MYATRRKNGKRALAAAESAKLANDLEAIPRAEALDRLLRAEAATERSLNRANDRLERLQRRRKGETFLLRYACPFDPKKRQKEVRSAAGLNLRNEPKNSCVFNKNRSHMS